MVSVDEDFFVLVRVKGSTTRVLLSDVTAAEEWELARSVVEFLGLPPPEEDEEPEPAPKRRAPAKTAPAKAAPKQAPAKRTVRRR